MPADDGTQCLPFSQIFNALEFYEFSIATNREGILFIQNIGNTRGHTSSKVLSGFAENDHHTTSHIFTAMCADTFDDRQCTTIAHSKAFASSPSDEELPSRCT